MSTITVSRDIAAGVEAVWTVITDLAGSVDVLSGVDRVEMLTDGPFTVGTTWRETRTVFGKQATEEMSVSAVDAPRSYTVTADSHGARYSSTFILTPIDAGTRLSMTFGAEPTSTGARVMAALTGWMAKGATTKMLRKDLEDIAAAAERLA